MVLVEKMGKDEEIFQVIKELSITKGKTISLTLIYRNVAARGIYTHSSSIKNTLKRLETGGKIKASSMNMIELLEEHDEGKQ